MDSVRAKWREVYNREMTLADVDAIFKDFEPIQMATLDKYSGLITGTAATFKKMKNDGLLVGTTTGSLPRSGAF